MKPQNPHTLTITTARQPTWRCAAIPTLSGCRPWRRLPITFRFPLFRGKEDGRQKHIKKQPALGFSMCRLLFQVRWISGVQAAFYALCSLCGELLVHRPPAPSPVGEGWGEGFSDCLPTCGRAAAQRVGMAAIRHALPLNFCARSGVPSPTEEGGGLLRPKNTDTESSLHPVFLRTIRRARHHSGNWI